MNTQVAMQGLTGKAMCRVLSLSVALAACSESHGGENGMRAPGELAGQTYVLCDRSSDVRLAAVSLRGGAAPEPTHPFTNPFGDSFLFVDGSCHYYASAAWMEGVVEATSRPCRRSRSRGV